MELIELNPKEDTRTYYYADGSKQTFRDVTHFAASTTTHRLRAEGRLVIVAEGWKWIEIEAAEFTV
jgi:hypothetical protein